MKTIQAELTVKRKEYLSPHYIRVFLTGEKVPLFANTTIGINNKILIPPKGSDRIHFPEFDYEKMQWKPQPDAIRPIVRTYTHRGIDLKNNEIWIDFIAHGEEGPASAWAINAQPGDLLGVLMRDGKTELYPKTENYLLIGDATGLPVLAAILEDLPKTANATCIIEVHGPEDEQPLKSNANAHFTWLYNKHPQKGSRLAEVVKQHHLPPAPHFGYVAAEFSSVKEIRNYLRKEKGWQREDLYAYSYWKAGMTEDKSMTARHQETEEYSMSKMTTTDPYYKVAIIGAGQAGLATSYYLQKSGIKHIVLEKNVIGSSWVSQRWDSFKMNTPNWMTALPEMPLPKATSQQFMTKNEFVDYLNKYVQQFKLPIAEAHQVIQLKKQEDSFTIFADNQGKRLEIKADFVVIASGIMNKPKFPKLAQKIPENILQLHASDYKNPNQLPDGKTLVVGGGQSGCQIAEEIALSGKKVYLASSKVPRAPRRYRGKDIMEWLEIMGIQDTLTQDVKSTAQLQNKQPQSSGVGVFGHTISYQSLHQLGVAILGSFKGINKKAFHFSDNAKENIRFADDTSQSIKENIDGFLSKHPELNTGITEEDEADLPDMHCSSASEVKEISIKQSEITSIIWATGFGYDFSYMSPSILNDKGSPAHCNGIMNTEHLYCIGFPWLRKKKSGLVFGIQEDAEFLVEKIKNTQRQ